MKKSTLKSTQNWSKIIMAIALMTMVSCNKAQETTTTEVKNEAPLSTIHEAAFFGNVKSIKEHIAFKSDLNQKDAYGSTPLHIAATFGKTEVAILLIGAGADLNSISGDGSTPLHTASFFCRAEIVKALLENGADVTIRNAYKTTALESVSIPFNEMKPIYDQISKDLGPLGLKLDYEQIEATRPVIFEMIKATTK